MFSELRVGDSVFGGAGTLVLAPFAPECNKAVIVRPQRISRKTLRGWTPGWTPSREVIEEKRTGAEEGTRTSDRKSLILWLGNTTTTGQRVACFNSGLGRKRGLFLHEQLDALIDILVDFQAAVADDDEAPKLFSRRTLVTNAIVLAAITLLSWWLYTRRFETTDDAQANSW